LLFIAKFASGKVLVYTNKKELIMYDFDKIISRADTNSAKWDAAAKGILPMWVADMDFQSPPEVIAALKERVSHGFFGYSGGYGGWFPALMQWMEKRYGWKPQQEWISTSPGVVAGLYIPIILPCYS
jgi:cystathionine beta-lyase